ncbi:MAG: hypothetical protein HDS25_05060 [Bacteroides sp.]|nr:hypothetical protein [Bacteroidales bacterium]MBD5295670.1 hypothetical protein [Bacteroides sp.]MDE6235040.1 hypothetical protein [Muribaculaceae bacterium]
MKKLLLSLALGLAAISASAVTPFLEFQPIQAGDDFTAFNFQGGFTGKVHPNIALGLGVGLTEKWNFDSSPLIPFFGRVDISGKMGSLNPFFSFDVGYELNTNDTDHGAVLVNPMVGLNFGRWYGGIGYLGHCWTQGHSGTTSCFNMKIGYKF